MMNVDIKGVTAQLEQYRSEGAYVRLTAQDNLSNKTQKLEGTVRYIVGQSSPSPVVFFNDAQYGLYLANVLSFEVRTGNDTWKSVPVMPEGVASAAATFAPGSSRPVGIASLSPDERGILGRAMAYANLYDYVNAIGAFTADTAPYVHAPASREITTLQAYTESPEKFKEGLLGFFVRQNAGGNIEQTQLSVEIRYLEGCKQT